jgi:phage baseplate assembly protein W
MAAPLNLYGIDVLCGSAGLDPNFSLVGGITTLAQDIYHRVITTLGSIFYIPNYGGSLIAALNSSVTSSTLQTIQMNVQNQIMEDERVANATVTGSYTVQSQTLILNCVIIPQNGSQAFQLVISVNQLTTALLSVTTV